MMFTIIYYHTDDESFGAPVVAYATAVLCSSVWFSGQTKFLCDLDIIHVSSVKFKTIWCCESHVKTKKQIGLHIPTVKYYIHNNIYTYNLIKYCIS